MTAMNPIRTVALLILVGGVTLLAAACGDDPTPTPLPISTETPVPTTTPIRTPTSVVSIVPTVTPKPSSKYQDRRRDTNPASVTVGDEDTDCNRHTHTAD